MDRQTFSELVSAIYDGAIDSAVWPTTLGLICKKLGFRKGTIDLNYVPGMTNLFNYHYGIDAEQAATMVSNYRAMPEVWGGLVATMTRPIDRPWVVSRIVSQEALRETAYYRNWVGPMGLVDGAAIVLARDHSLFGSIRLATDSSRGIIDDSLVDKLAQLLPHCQRAARISGLLDLSRNAARDFKVVIDSTSVPIILVSANGVVVHANIRGQAMLRQGEILTTRQGRLASPVADLQQTIGDTIRRLTRDETDIAGSGIGLSVRVEDNSTRTLHLLPLGQGEMRVKLAGEAVAAIFVSGEPAGQTLTQDVLESMFQLTPAEIGVFERIFEGRTTREIAADLKIAPSTVRTHILHVFQKTSTNSRADLVRLAHTLTRPVAS